jgi:hypothetical protein
MDKEGSKLSLEGLEVLIGVKTQGRKHTQDVMLPSASAVKNVARIIEAFGKYLVSYLMTNLPEGLRGGEPVSFSKPDAIKLLLKATGLQEAAKTRQIVLPSSCDTVVVSKNAHFLMEGLKINDRTALTPVTKRPLFLAGTDRGEIYLAGTVV